MLVILIIMLVIIPIAWFVVVFGTVVPATFVLFIATAARPPISTAASVCVFPDRTTDPPEQAKSKVLDKVQSYFIV